MLLDTLIFLSGHTLCLSFLPQLASPVCKKGLFAHGEAEADLGRVQEGPFCTREAAAGGSRGQGGAVLHTGRAGDGGMRQRAGVSTPRHGQGEGPGGYKFPRSGDAVDAGRGRSERSEWSPARCWQTAGKTSVTRSRGQEKLFCTRKATAGMSRGQEGLFCTREAVAYTSRGAERAVLHTGGRGELVPGA